jgi:hypothetical protein
VRNTFISLLLVTTLSSCGGSGTSSLGGSTLEGNVISTTVEVEQRFLYALNSAEGSVSGFVLESGEETGHDHDHAHGRILAQEHDHDHGHGEEGEPEGLELRELDSSPYTFGGAPPIDMAVDGHGETLFLLDNAGNLWANAIDGVTGLLTAGEPVATGVSNPRMLRISADGNALAVLGDGLAIYAIGEGGLSARSFRDGTGGWSDVRVNGALGVGADSEGAIGFSWLPGAVIDTRPTVPLPGDGRGQIAYAEAGIFVVNGGDVSVSQLSQAEDGSLALVASFGLPDELTDPQTITSIFEGEDLLVGDSDSVVLLHPHEDELEEEGHVDLDQAPSVLFPIPESAFVLVGHAAGEGYHLLEVGEEGIEILEEAEGEHSGISAFGFAERVEQVTRTVNF